MIYFEHEPIFCSVLNYKCEQSKQIFLYSTEDLKKRTQYQNFLCKLFF